MSDRLTPQREAEIAEQLKQALSNAGAFCGECGFEPGDRGCEDCEWCYRRFAEGLLPILREVVAAERAAVRAERDQAKARIAELEDANREVVEVSETLYQRLHDEKLAGSALYAALTMPTTPEQRQAALERFLAVAEKTGQLHAPTNAEAVDR